MTRDELQKQIDDICNAPKRTPKPRKGVEAICPICKKRVTNVPFFDEERPEKDSDVWGSYLWVESDLGGLVPAREGEDYVHMKCMNKAPSTYHFPYIL